jgi:hypothetical protein
MKNSLKSLGELDRQAQFPNGHNGLYPRGPSIVLCKGT